MQKSDLAGLGVLLVEDEELLRRAMASYFEKLDADVTGAGTLASARQSLVDSSFDLAFVDVNLPDGSGLSLLKEKLFPAHTGVIVMTAEGMVGGAVEAMRLGALDYLVKPFDFAQLLLGVQRARRAKQTERVDEHRRGDLGPPGGAFIFGPSLAPIESQLQKILAADQRLQTFLSPVLIQGETGTGKTSVARWIHQCGPRAKFPLVEVNCSALPESLAESELFGHERGAFTDARAARMGLFEAAHGGTLFLDELPSLSLPLQAKVLKTIEDHRIRRVGGNKEIPIDVRVMAATNTDLKARVAEGHFREDLYHRLDLFRIMIPPLRERGNDILNLAEALLESHCKRHRLPKKKIDREGRQRLLSFPWPGNVRELSHEIERAVVFDESDELKFETLSPLPLPTYGAADADSGPDWFRADYVFPPRGFSMDEAINRLLRHALKQADGNVSAAARLLGVSRDYVRYRLAGKQREEGETSPE